MATRRMNVAPVHVALHGMKAVHGLVVLALVAGAIVGGCQMLPVPLAGGDLIVMEVRNRSGQPATLVVAAPGTIQDVVGAVDPAVVAAHQTVDVRFFVPSTGWWAIWANGGELMGKADVGARRGAIPMGIEIDAGGVPSWWCGRGCP